MYAESISELERRLPDSDPGSEPRAGLGGGTWAVCSRASRFRSYRTPCRNRSTKYDSGGGPSSDLHAVGGQRRHRGGDRIELGGGHAGRLR
jgi:hypothetical protein